MKKNLSEFFAGANTASIKERNEKQLKKLDAFTEDFAPPGTEDSSPGVDKHERPIGARQTLTDADTSSATVDQISYELECRIKGMDNQFPGAKKEPASDNAAFDKALTDPMLILEDRLNKLGIK